MRKAKDILLSLSLSTALLLALAWVCGFRPDTILDGAWQSDGDHPTNYLDASLHPDGPAR